MTKADRIRKLAAEGKSDAEIAEIVGCERSYVRTAARQRRDGRKSVGDQNYHDRVYRHGDREAANAARRARYAELRQKGMPWREASNKTANVYHKTMRGTGRHG